MRDYGKVMGTFWTGDTGRKLRGHPEAQLVAVYLMTSPMANMIGLYHLPVAIIAHHTGLPIDGARKGLQRASEGGFCHYDDEREEVYVPEMAAYQIGEPLEARDKNVVGIYRQWIGFRKSQFFRGFHKRYAASYHLPPLAAVLRGIEGASKPHRSQEQEQEREQEQEQEREKDVCSEPPRTAASEPPPVIVCEFPVAGGKPGAAWALTQAKFDEYLHAFPGVDVSAEILKARQWCLDNATRRKTARGMPAFLGRWLGKAQDRAPRQTANTPATVSFRDGLAAKLASKGGVS